MSRRLDNILSCHVGALWTVNPCEKGTCSIAVDDVGQDDRPVVF